MSDTTNKKNYALPIAMMFALFAMISFVTGLTNPLGVIVKNQFDVPNWMTQLGNAANFIAYAFMGIPAGMMLKKIGYKKTALAAIAVGFIGVGIQFFSGQLDNSICFRFFYVYAEYGREPDVEYIGRWRKKRKSADSVRWFFEFHFGNDRSYSRRLFDR